MKLKHFCKLAIAFAVAFSAPGGAALAADKTLKIGFVGVTSGPKAAWGISNVRCMQTRAKWLNEEGGIRIGGDTYEIEIVTWDTQDNTTRAREGMEKMVQEGIHYVVGPNTDPTAAAVRPVAEKDGVMYFPYAFPKELYSPPAGNAVLGMIANYQSGPAIYKYLKENKGVRSIAFLAANESDALSQRDGGVRAAKALGLNVVAESDAYQSDTRDFVPVVTPLVKLNPDLLVLSGVAGGTAPLVIRALRELGYKGFISTETAQDAEQLREGAGSLANGFISVGGASTPKIRSAKMEEFIRRYTEDHGQYDDESNTKVYALEYILEMLKAHPQAISNVRCMQTRAKWLNEEGGIRIGGDTYEIEIVTWDTQDNTTRAREGMEKMVQEGIHYVVGPNTDPTAAAVRPVAEKDGVMYFPYAFPKELYSPPAGNAVLGMIANYQSGPAIYKYLKENKGVRSIAFLAANESDALSQRDGGVRAAKALGLNVVAESDAYQSDTRDFVPVVTPLVKLNPDLLVLSGVAGGTAPLVIRALRELGYKGFISTETAQDAEQLREGAGSLANGFISVGGASTPKIRFCPKEKSPTKASFSLPFKNGFGAEKVSIPRLNAATSSIACGCAFNISNMYSSAYTLVLDSSSYCPWSSV